MSLIETVVPADELSLVAAHPLSVTVYDVPIMVRRQLPTAWPSAAVALGTSPVASTIATVNGAKYVVFEVVPNQGTLSLTVAGATTDPAPKIWPNPFADKITLEAKGNFTYTIYSLNGKLL